MQAAAAAASKDLAALERKEVGLQEKRKHASGRAKKLKKSVQDVSRACLFSGDGFRILRNLQDTSARKAALNTIEDSTEKMEKEKEKLKEHEKSLKVEEKILEEIRDSLHQVKG